MPILQAFWSARLGGLSNISDIASAAGIPYTTMTRYIASFEATFMIVLLLMV
jgi:AcrR family transcriptional regulator